MAAHTLHTEQSFSAGVQRETYQVTAELGLCPYLDHFLDLSQRHDQFSGIDISVHFMHITQRQNMYTHPRTCIHKYAFVQNNSLQDQAKKLNITIIS